MKILVLSRTAWRKDNSFGNTYSNIFGDMKDVEIANIYLADGKPDYNDNVVSYYQISEKEITKSVLKARNKTFLVGKEVFPEEKSNNTENNQDPSYETMMLDMKKKRWPIFFIARELIWRFGQPNLNNMMEFVERFNPDIIFLSFYYAAYVDRIALYIKSKINVPIVLEAAIDIYSLKQLSFDPFFWINRFYIRSYIRRTVIKSEKLYVISEKMRNDYERMLKIPCSVLYKFPDTQRKKDVYCLGEGSLKYLYAGNIGAGRWKSLAVLADALTRTNGGRLDIYTHTPLTSNMKKALVNSVIHDPVSYSKIIDLQNESDVLVHAESFDTKNKLAVRYSISTKIMDYLSVGHCIFAIGPKDIASIEYLSKNDLAIIASSKKEISDEVENITKNPDVILEYAKNAETFIAKMSSPPSQQELLREDLQRIIDSYNC